LNKNRNNILDEWNKEKKIAHLFKSIEEGAHEDLIAERINELKKESLISKIEQIGGEVPYESKKKDIESAVKIIRKGLDNIRKGLDNSDSGKLNIF